MSVFPCTARITRANGQLQIREFIFGFEAQNKSSFWYFMNGFM